MTGFTILEVTSNLSFDVEEGQRGAEERKADTKEENQREAEVREAEPKKPDILRIDSLSVLLDKSFIYLT